MACAPLSWADDWEAHVNSNPRDAARTMMKSAERACVSTMSGPEPWDATHPGPQPARYSPYRNFGDFSAMKSDERACVSTMTSSTPYSSINDSSVRSTLLLPGCTQMVVL